MDRQNFFNETFEYLPAVISCSNFFNCTFKEPTGFDRCNLHSCVFEYPCVFIKSNVIDDEEEDMRRPAHRPER